MQQEGIQQKEALANSLERAIKRNSSLRRQLSQLRRKFAVHKTAVKRSATLFLLLALISCTSLGNLTAGEDTRAASLNEPLNKFTKAVSWSIYEEAALYLKQSEVESYLRKTSEQKRVEKMVEAKVRDIAFEDDNNIAKVEFEIRYFKIPSYYVRTRLEEHTWKYHRLNGWILHEQRLLSDEGQDAGPRVPG